MTGQKLGLFAVMVLTALGWTAVAWAGEPAEAIQDTRREVYRILHDDALRQPGMKEERRRQLNDVISERLTYEEISHRVLGSEWDRLSADERQEFIRLFRMLLCNMYAHKIEDYGGEPMEVLAERVERDFAEVRTSMVARKKHFILDFRLVNRNGEWRVFDILTDGISLVSNYRQQFQRVLRFDSYSELLHKLRDATERSNAAFARH